MEEYLLDEVFRTHADLSQDAHVVLPFHLHEHLLPPVLFLDKPRFHGLAAQNHIDFFLFFARLRHNDPRALARLLEFEHSILRLPYLSMDDLLVLVEDGPVEKLPSGGLDGELGDMSRH